MSYRSCGGTERITRQHDGFQFLCVVMKLFVSFSHSSNGRPRSADEAVCVCS